jgi:hypothetical protein
MAQAAPERQCGLGYFDDEVEAARSYDAAAQRLHGEYAFLNFPEEATTRGHGRGESHRLSLPTNKAT